MTTSNVMFAVDDRHGVRKRVHIGGNVYAHPAASNFGFMTQIWQCAAILVSDTRNEALADKTTSRYKFSEKRPGDYERV